MQSRVENVFPGMKGCVRRRKGQAHCDLEPASALAITQFDFASAPRRCCGNDRQAESGTGHQFTPGSTVESEKYVVAFSRRYPGSLIAHRENRSATISGEADLNG